MRQPLGFNRRA